jgi:hypothetical protein
LSFSSSSSKASDSPSFSNVNSSSDEGLAKEFEGRRGRRRISEVDGDFFDDEEEDLGLLVEAIGELERERGTMGEEWFWEDIKRAREKGEGIIIYCITFE